MVFENSHHHHRWFLAGSTIGSDGFSMVFPILGTNVSRWLQTEIRDKLRVNKHLFQITILIILVIIGLFDIERLAA